MTDDRGLRSAYELGEQVKKFLQTDPGRYLDGCTQQDIDAAKDALLELDPYKYTTLVELQNAIAGVQAKAISAMKLRTYLAEAILSGDQAGRVLTGDDESDNG